VRIEPSFSATVDRVPARACGGAGDGHGRRGCLAPRQGCLAPVKTSKDADGQMDDEAVERRILRRSVRADNSIRRRRDDAAWPKRGSCPVRTNCATAEPTWQLPPVRPERENGRTMESMADTKTKVRVVVADDHPLYRDGVVRALTASGRVDVVAQAEDGRGALEQIREHQPEVALIDYKLPSLDGVSVVHAVSRDGLPTRVLMLSAFTDSGLVYEALQTGASGYLPKEAKRDEIVDAVLACARGEVVIPPELTAGLVSEIRIRRANDTPVLTDREREILNMIAAGKSLPEIAKELFLGVTTVKTHVHHLYEKLGVSDRAAAVAEAMRRRLIE
jgi:two-component system, NarL family, nitrate/nitrite response regulator NarL